MGIFRVVSFCHYLIPVLILILIVGILDGMGYNLIQCIETYVLPDSPELANGIFLKCFERRNCHSIAIGGFLVWIQLNFNLYRWNNIFTCCIHFHGLSYFDFKNAVKILNLYYMINKN